MYLHLIAILQTNTNVQILPMRKIENGSYFIYSEALLTNETMNKHARTFLHRLVLNMNVLISEQKNFQVQCQPFYTLSL